MLVLAMPGLLVAALLQAAAATLAQGSRRVLAGVSRPDSAHVVHLVRSEQKSFELFRRNRLPVGEHFEGPCDVRVGRYCYWRGDEDDEDDQPPPEPSEIREHRDRLIRLLDSATSLLPGDPWLAGQHVRYLVEAGRIDDAIGDASTNCRAGPNWCNALAGYAAHVGGRFALADSAFGRALASMDSAQRCRWLDASDLLDDDLENRFKTLDCTAREGFVRRVFWLGSPLYSVSGSDLLTEHFARLTYAQIAEHSAMTDGEPWDDDERELVLRYGWPRWYSRTMPPFGSELRPSVTGHDAGRPYDFLPALHAVDHLGHLTADDWNLDAAAATTGYAPSYARTVHDVPHQIAVFRRGDSTTAVAAWDARKDTTLIGRPLDVALVLANDSTPASYSIERLHDGHAEGRIAVTGVIDSGIVSLELLARADRRAARARIGIPKRIATRVALSDLLLYAPSDRQPSTLAAARDSMLASTVVPMSRSLGVYWEMYGLEPQGEPVRFTLSVQQVQIGWMQRAAEHLHLSDPSSALRIQWDEVPQRTDGITGGGVRLDLSGLRSGHYHLELSAVARGKAAAASGRDIEVR